MGFLWTLRFPPTGNVDRVSWDYTLIDPSTIAAHRDKTRAVRGALAISHFPIENRKASMDCLEGQSKVAENFKS